MPLEKRSNGSATPEAKRSLPEPIAWIPDTPDGGWGWVVVFATFMVHVIADGRPCPRGWESWGRSGCVAGIVYSFGIMVVEFLAEFRETRGLTSWILSILTGLTLGAGPLAAAVTQRFGCRITTMVGAVIASFGCAISYFATSVLFLVVSVGVIVGTEIPAGRLDPVGKGALFQAWASASCTLRPSSWSRNTLTTSEL